MRKVIGAIGLGLAVLAVGVLPASALPTPVNNPLGGIANPWSTASPLATRTTQEANLYEIYNTIYGTSLTAAQFAEIILPSGADQTFWASDTDALLVSRARYAGLVQRYGAYPLGAPGAIIDQETVTSTGRFGLNGFNLSYSGDGVVEIPLALYGGPPATFGIFDQPVGSGYRLRSQEALNTVDGGLDHFVAAWSPLLPDGKGGFYRELFIGVEDNLPLAYGGSATGADWDYQDLVITLRYANAIVPEPASLTLLGIGLAGLGLRRFRMRK